MKTYFFLLILLIASINLFGQWNKIFTIDNNNLSVPYIINDKVFLLGEYGKVYTSLDKIIFDEDQIIDYNYFTNIYFVNNDIGYISGGCYYPFSECPTNTLFKTLDAGKTWQKVVHPSFFDTDSNGLGTVLTFKYLSDSEIVISKEFPFSFYKVNISNGSFELLEIPSNINPQYDIKNKIDFSNNERWIMVLVDKSSSKSILYQSKNFGQNWTILLQEENLPGPMNFAKVLSNGDVYIGSDTELAFIVNDFGVETIHSSSLPNNIFKSQFVDDHNAYLVVNTNNNGIVYKSTDVGRSWVEDFYIENSSISDSYFTKGNEGLVITDWRSVFFRQGSSTTYDESCQILQLHPNPTDGIIHFDFTPGHGSTYAFKIFSASGRKVLVGNVIDQSIDIGNLSRGLYFIELSDEFGQNTLRSKVVKY